MTALVPAACGALVALAALWLWVRRRLVVVTVEGPSMEPALRDGDRVLVRRVPLPKVRTGQMMVARRPSLPGRPEDAGPLLIKRVVAVGGDPVPAEVRAAIGDDRVPHGCLVVLGDNRARSADSRHWGYITAEHLLGVVLRGMSPATPRGPVNA